jgi:hypothetical protein
MRPELLAIRDVRGTLQTRARARAQLALRRPLLRDRPADDSANLRQAVMSCVKIADGQEWNYS